MTLDEKTRAVDRLASNAGVCPQRDSGKTKIASVVKRYFCTRDSSFYGTNIEKIFQTIKGAPDPAGHYLDLTPIPSKKGLQGLFH